MAEVKRDRRRQHDETGKQDARVGREDRPWPVKVLTWLLFFQGISLLAIGLFHVDLWAGLQQILTESSFFASLPGLGTLALVAGVGFLYPRPGAWVMAMLVQGLTLLVTLLFYFRYRPDNLFLYAIMVYAIVMVLYLNYAQVPHVFRGDTALVAEVGDE